MNNNVFPTGSEDKIKSYWNRPSGKIGTVIGIFIFLLIGFFIFPLLTSVVWNMINLAIACTVAFVLYMVLINKKLWLGLFYLYEILMKKFIGLVIELDPFIIAKDYIRDTEKQRDILYNKIVEVDAQKEAIIAKIASKEREKIKQLDKAAVAQKNGQNMEMGAAARQAERLDVYLKQLTPIKVNLTNISEYLTKVHKNSKFMIDDMKCDLELKSDLYKSVTSGNNAMKSAMKIFNGDIEKKMLMEQSMDYFAEDIALKLASMKKAVDCSSDFMKSIDLENGVYEEAGLRMLEEYKPELFMSKNHLGESIYNKPVATPTNSSQYDNLI